jgi:SpoVK/Ycf46/Vps4 family AAA+-type ATPase
MIFDEADTIIGSRKNDFNSHKEDKKLLETIMINLQNIQEYPNVYSILMSNMPKECDEAAMRAGRIDQKWEIGLPTEKDREEAFSKSIKTINNRAGYEVIRNCNSLELAKITPHFNYADIDCVVKSALNLKARELSLKRKSGKVISGFIGQNRLETAILEHKEKFLQEIDLKRYIL